MVPEASGSVSVRLAVSVVGVRVTPKLPDPPARPCRITESCVAAAIALAVVNVPAAGAVPPIAGGEAR